MSQSEKSRGVLLYTPKTPRALPSRSISGAIRADTRPNCCTNSGRCTRGSAIRSSDLAGSRRLHGRAQQAAVHRNRVGRRDRSGGGPQRQHPGIARIDFPDRGVLHVEQIAHTIDQQREDFVGRVAHQVRRDFFDGVEQLRFLNGDDGLRRQRVEHAVDRRR